MYDCIIVGTGPAGGAAAYHLAKRGRAVLLLEKELLPRHKTCAGEISPAVASWFDFDFTPAIICYVSTMRFTWRTEEPLESELGATTPAWGVRRSTFDNFIVQQSSRQGAEVRDGADVTGIELQGEGWEVRTAAGSFRGRYLIAADGAKGRLARLLGFTRRKYLLAGSIEADIPAEQIDEGCSHFDFGQVAGGYLWKFPRNGSYSLGVGAMRGYGPQQLRAILESYIRDQGLQPSAGVYYGHPLLAWNGRQRLDTSRALLAGEAACLVDPFSFEGIRPALFSGMKAAEAIDRALAGESDALARYSRLIHEQLGKDMAFARRLSQLFYRFPRRGYDLMQRHPSSIGTILKVFTGELRYSEVARQAVKQMLRRR